MTLVPLCPWALCVSCRSRYGVPVRATPRCCSSPRVISLYTESATPPADRSARR